MIEYASTVCNPSSIGLNQEVKRAGAAKIHEETERSLQFIL